MHGDPLAHRVVCAGELLRVLTSYVPGPTALFLIIPGGEA